MAAKITVDSILAALTDAHKAGTLDYNVQRTLLTKLSVAQLTELVKRVNASGYARVPFAITGSKNRLIQGGAGFWRYLVPELRPVNRGCRHEAWANR